MDPFFNELSDSNAGFELNHDTIFPSSDPYLNLTNGFKFADDSLDLNFRDLPFLPSDQDTSNSAPSSNESPEERSPSDESDDPVLRYISQMLMEEDMENKPCMLRDSLALHAAEKSFYEVLGEKYPPSPNQRPFYQNFESPDDNFSLSFSDYSRNSTGTSNSGDPQYIGHLGEFKTSFQRSQIPIPNFLSDSESILQFRRGVEEASKFLPSNNTLIIDLENYTSALDQKEVASEVVVKAESGEREHSPNGSRGRKRQDEDLEDGRNNKQSAVFVEEDELLEMFDRILLCSEGKEEACRDIVNDVSQNGQPHGSNGKKSRAKKQSNNKEMVDLRSLLILCAQAVSSNDRRTATELLDQIRQNSSASGNGSQRLAHSFANGLEARLAGTGTQIYTALASKKISAADILKAYQVYIQACPFNKISILFANQMIFNAAEKAKTLHLIDFGICYGFQWPMLIQHLSTRPGGPPRLRITGIELPQPGFRPAERVEETGRRLAKYCERFNVPFEYNAIAQKWETTQIEDLKIDSNEVLAVNCLYRFHNMLDETVLANSPRDAVLKLIRKINPDVFVHAIVNGSYNAPFFVTRFREALFHFSALFDMFDATVSQEDAERLMFEKEFYGREVMNVIACEGSERVERPEMYKQWQSRTARAGFRQLPLDQGLIKKLRGKLEAWYHKDFVIDEDGRWMLLGWKGRVVCASSCWVPA